MAQDRTKSSFLTLLRRTAKSAQASVGARSASDENALWGVYERSAARARESSEAAQRLAGTIAKQRSAVDAAADRTRVVGTRAQELMAAARRVLDGFERLGIVALNAGLEGARLGETAGRALLLVAEEVRGNAARGADASRELAALLTELATELGQLQAQVGHARDASADVAHEATRAATAFAEVEKALGEVGERLRKATGSDPEQARAVAEAAEHARALVNALATLSGKVPRTLLVSALRPVLEPLVRLLAEDDDEEPHEDEGERRDGP